MPKTPYTSLPSGYAVCEHYEDPLADTCLHQLAFGEQLSRADGCEFYLLALS